MEILCPLCNQENLLKAQIKKLEIEIFFCRECDALWKLKDVFSEEKVHSFLSFMANNDLKTDYSDIKIPVQEHPLITGLYYGYKNYILGLQNIVMFSKDMLQIAKLADGGLPENLRKVISEFATRIDDIRCTIPKENYRQEVEKAYETLKASLPEDLRKKFEEI